MEKINFNDKELIESYLMKANYNISNYNIISLYIWDNFSNIHYFYTDKFMILLCVEAGVTYFLAPLCEKEHLLEALKFIEDYCQENNLKLLMKFVPFNVATFYSAIKGYRMSEMLDSFDYLYEVEKMISLTGKKLQKKRNHLNNFYKNYQNNFLYKEIDNFDDVYEFLTRWQNNHATSPFLDYEYLGLKELLNNITQFDCHLSGIYINNRLEAFTMASILSKDTVQINIEKANKNIQGLYVLMQKLQLETSFSNFKYVNREDDMGQPLLRAAKEAYYPSHYIRKYELVGNKR